jgi:non-specific serine/threonine protein kinase
MTLSAGHRIGNYEVLGPAGSGGMGEVYRARDSRLDRIVAIKALPAGFAANSERLGRFEREARLLASLNHPNIAGIHGIEDAPKDTGGPYLVLEFVEGETLAQRLARGSIPVSDTIHLMTQIASAIEAAHEKGIIHRDLKPANVMITASNTAKVLDFGLAKGDEEQAPESDDNLTASPTLATPATADGVVLGTAPYMSPEQARGKTVDKRVDVWAFGCIVMECLTGRQPFSGETASDVIAKILEREPDYDQVPSTTPPRLVEIIRRCLTKDANQRPRDIGDLGRELRAIESDSASRPVRAAQDTVPSLAVLYFENLAQDPDSEYFCAGITEDILTDLSKIKGLRVASKNAVSRYRGTVVDHAKVAVDLGVKALLEGSVRRAGDRIRITTQLINAADGFQLWAERFDRTLDDVFAVQDEIATAIVEALRVAMTPSDVKEIARDRPADARAYDLYLKGREQYDRYQKETMREALDLFQQAIAIDPNYALAWAGVADCHGQINQSGWSENKAETLRVGLEAAEKAISIDAKLPEAYKAQALVLRQTGDGEGAYKSLVRAIEIDPNFTPALMNLGVECYIRANLARAERLVRRVLEIDPQECFAWLLLTEVLVVTNREAETLSVTRRMRDLSAEVFYVTVSFIYEIKAHVQLGNIDAAERAHAAALEAGADHSKLLPVKGLVAAHAGRIEEAREILRQIEGKGHFHAGIPPAIAATALRLEEPETALRVFEQLPDQQFVPIAARLNVECHPLLDRPPLAPRKSPLTLVWPLQAPMIDEARFSVFSEVRIESGRPEGTDILGESSVGGGRRGVSRPTTI